MHIKKKYRELEKIEEVRVYNFNEEDLIQDAPQIQKPKKVRFSNIIKHVRSDVNIFLPIDDGEDYIVERIGWNLLERINGSPSDVEGRKLSQVSPFYYKVFKDALKEVYETRETKAMRMFYYVSDRITTIANVYITFDEGDLYIISDLLSKPADVKKTPEEQKREEDENKANMIEYFSQTGSYYKTRNEYTWTPGIYNIINRSREPNDSFYNIIFDLVIPEDKPLVEELIETMSPETDSYENIIRIKTRGGHIKYLDTYLYSKFDENGEEISNYGLFKDVSVDSHKHITRPVDFMLNGFNHNTKLSLLVEPLSKRYEFSEGFYRMIEVPKDEYIHTKAIIDNIVEEDVREELEELIKDNVSEVNRIFTYNVHGDEDNQKVCELFIEKFQYGNKTHSIGFLTDITYARQKQIELMESNATKNILIKEVHHRVKNNLQVLSSFLNLERRAYSNPDNILDNMQARLSSLALLHEKTYNTEDFINVNLADYLEDQDSTLHSLFRAKNIHFISDVNKDIHLPMDIMTPLLLIIDELTMNAIKHAFPNPDMPNKTIFKKIDYVEGEPICELILRDNGVGLDSPESLINHNLGWEIINNLTKQINGQLEILDCEVGTGFKILFPATFEHTIEYHLGVEELGQ